MRKVVLLLALSVIACSPYQVQQAGHGAVQGGLLGAGMGAAIGALAGNPGQGAAIGAIAGATTGAAVGVASTLGSQPQSGTVVVNGYWDSEQHCIDRYPVTRDRDACLRGLRSRLTRELQEREAWIECREGGDCGNRYRGYNRYSYGYGRYGTISGLNLSGYYSYRRSSGHHHHRHRRNHHHSRHK